MQHIVILTLLTSSFLSDVLAPQAQAADYHTYSQRKAAAYKKREEFDLTDNQIQHLKEAGLAHAKAVKPLLEQLRRQVSNNSSNNDIQATLDQFQIEEGKLRESRAAILTPMQRAKILLDVERKKRQSHTSRNSSPR